MRSPVYVPPHSREAEASVLGSLMQWPDTQDAVAGLSPDEFFERQNGLIFRAILELSASGKTPDMLTVYESMREDGHEIDLAYLNEMAAVGSPAKGSVERHAQIVRERATRRRLLSYASSLHESGQSALTTGELVELAMSSLYSIIDTRVSKVPRQPGEIIGKHLVDLERRVEDRRAGRKIATTTGLVDLDTKLGGGYRPGELVIMAGRPSMGKTALALTGALRQAKAGYAVLFLSQEMRTEELLDRSLSAHASIDLQSIRTGAIAENQWPALARVSQELAEMPLYFDDQASLALLDVRAKARAVRARGKLDVLYVDYLQLMVGEGENRTREIGSLSRGLKALSKELNCTVVALSQLNRGVESRADRRPGLADLRESGDIEADADVVMMLYRDEVYHPDTADKGVAEVIVSKQRSGPIGTVLSAFRGPLARFDNFLGTPPARPVAQPATRPTSYASRACPD